MNPGISEHGFYGFDAWKKSPGDYLLPTCFLGILLILTLRWLSTPNLPTINAYPGDFTRRKARADFMPNAGNLLSEGLKRYNGPFRMFTTLGSRVILPASWATWVKSCHDLDHSALVCEEYFADYPGMEGQAALHDPRGFVFEVIRTRMNQNSQCQIIHDHVLEVLQEIWTDHEGLVFARVPIQNADLTSLPADWHSVNFCDLIRTVARVSSAIFVGPDLARSPQWQNLIITYTISFFNGARALRGWPAPLRTFVHRFLPECKIAREQVRLARSLFKEVLVQRAAAKKAAEAEGRNIDFNDSIQWIEDVAKGRSFDAAAVQLGLAMGALHTTTELLKQGILDICSHPELIGPIREEAEQAVRESGWSTAGLFKMQLLDSVLKETQRLKPGPMVGLERKALKPVTLPNGLTLPRGTRFAVECSMMSDPKIYPNPDTFDGYRFLKLRRAGDNTAVLSSTSPRHVAFGMGRSICPGRFFAANEVKILIAQMLLSYDIRLAEGYQPRLVHYGFEMLSDPEAKIEVRKRVDV